MCLNMEQAKPSWMGSPFFKYTCLRPYISQRLFPVRWWQLSMLASMGQAQYCHKMSIVRMEEEKRKKK